MMGRTPYWKLYPKQFSKCELSACNYTAEPGFGVCTFHRQIAFSESRGTYKGNRTSIGSKK